MKINALHPFLFVLFPVVFLYAHNVDQMRAPEIILPAFLGLAATALLMALLKLFIRDPYRRALLASLLVALFFSFGHVVRLLAKEDLFADQADASAEPYVFLAMLVILGVVGALVLRTRANLSRLSTLLTQVAGVLVVLQALLVAYSLVTRPQAEVQVEQTAPLRQLDRPAPDIYFIILDGYARHDVLEEIYGYDNGDFLAALEARGFYVADSSWSNYCATAQSLTATLNVDYLDRIMPVDPREFSRTPAAVMLERNRVVDLLRRYGYKVAAFATGYAPTEVEFADYYFKPRMALSEFQNHLLNSTPIPFLTRSLKSQFDLHRDRLSYILDKLPNLGDVPSPKFVFAHVTMPHPPFVFDSAGAPIARAWPFSFADGDHYTIQGGTVDEYIAGYRGQAKFISKRILGVIDTILSRSPVPPIIALQADHGPGSRLYWEDPIKTDHRERFAILNALYLPGIRDSLLYESISPVNTFRVILNECFGTRFELLPDRSFYTTRSRPYRYFDVTATLVGGGKKTALR